MTEQYDAGEEVVSFSDEQLAEIDAMSLETLMEDLREVSQPGFIEDAGYDSLGAVEPALESLMAIADSIRVNGGICRADAQTLHQMTGSLEGMSAALESMPINSFTAAPSKVNFEVSLENIFVNAGRKILEMIRKIITWIKEKLSAAKAWFINNTTRANKVRSAGEKVEAELKSAKADLKTASKANSKRRDGKAPSEPVQIDIPSLAYHLATDGNALMSASISLVKLSDAFQKPVTAHSKRDILPPLSNLARALFDDTSNTSRYYAEYSAAYTAATSSGEIGDYERALLAIVRHCSEMSTSTDVMVVNDPVTKFVSMVNAVSDSAYARDSAKIAKTATTTIPIAKKSAELMEATIAKATAAGERIALEDPAMVSVKKAKSLVRIYEILCGIDAYLIEARGHIVKAANAFSNNLNTKQAA